MTTYHATRLARDSRDGAPAPAAPPLAQVSQSRRPRDGCLLRSGGVQLLHFGSGWELWRRLGFVVVLPALAALLVSRRVAAADDKPTLSGSWTASALTESWSVSDWGEACGPRPAPQGSGGGPVQIREQGGELSIVGAGRAFTTAQCWEQMPGVSRTSHSQSGGGRFWRTRCTSSPGDSRRAAITTSISATDTSIALSETGDYTFIIKDTNCHASVTRSRSYSLVKRDGDSVPPPPPASVSAAPPPPPPLPPTAPEPRSASRCTGGGDPARLEVHPAKKLLRAGDHFTFRAVVLDGDGCATGTRPIWAIGPGPLASKASIDAGGTLAVAADAAEGKLEVTASVGGKGVTVNVEVASPEHYDALLGLSGLNDAGEADQTAIAVIAVGTIGGRTAVAQDAARERKSLFVAIVGAVAVVLAFVGLVLARRGTRPAEAIEEEHPVPSNAPPSDEVQGPLATPPEGAAPEIPASLHVAAEAQRKPASRGKICPTCGERYPGDAAFCGKDATKLVLLN